MLRRVRDVMLPIAAVATLTLTLGAANAGASSLSGSLGNGAVFPARTLVLSAPAGITVSVPHMYIWENGGPVDNLSVTPLSHANAGDFGVVLVIDQSASMKGAPLAHALAAARAFAAQRTGNQELGLIAFDSVPTTVLPLTSDPRAIRQVLSATPWTGTGTKILPAVTLALKQLGAAKIADGAVVVLSDGASGAASSAAAQSVTAAALRQHIPIFTVGLRDRSFTPGLLRQLAQGTGGKYVAATGAQVPDVFTSIAASLTQRYLVRYRSIVPAGRHVAVKIRVDGISTLLRLGYNSPASAATPGSPVGALPQTGGPSSRQPVGGTATQHRLTGVPSFAAPPVAAPKPVPGRVSGWKPAPTRRSFWTSSLALLAVPAGCALLIGLGVAILLYRRPQRRAVQRRVGTFILASNAELTEATGDQTRPGRLAALLGNMRWWPAFVEQVHTARIGKTPLALVERSALACVIVAVVLVGLTGSIVLVVLPVLATPFMLRAWVARGARRQRKLFSEQLPSNLQDLAGAMRAGRSFIGAISAVAETAAEPMRGEFERAATDERLGLPLEETLEAIARRMNAKDMDQIALIAALHRSSGSNVAEALERVAEGARDRADLAREMRALTGQARLSSWVLSGLPPLMLGALSVIAPSYSHPLFHTTLGMVMLGVAAVMVLCGWLVMKRIVNPEA